MIGQAIEARDRPERAHPLGIVWRPSNQIHARLSEGLHTGAANLLTKARRALTVGDVDRALGYLDHADRLPFDEHEQVRPGWHVAYTELVMAVTSALEECPENDCAWLDAAIEVLTAHGAGWGAAAVRCALATAAEDWTISRREKARIAAAVGPVPPPEVNREPPADAQARVTGMMDMVMVTIAYEEALERAFDRE